MERSSPRTRGVLRQSLCTSPRSPKDLATHGLKEHFENIEDENIIDKDLMAHDDDSFKEEMLEEVESFIDEMLNSDRHHGACPYDALFDFDNLKKTILDVFEEMLHVDGHETIYAIGDRKPQHYGTANTDWQKDPDHP